MQTPAAANIMAEAVRREGEDITSDTITKAYKELRRKKLRRRFLTEALVYDYKVDTHQTFGPVAGPVIDVMLDPTADPGEEL